MSALIWTLIATVALAAIITVYIFISAARIFGAESDNNTPPVRQGRYKKRASSDRRENSDRRVYKGTIEFPLVDRFGHTVSANRRKGDRRTMSDRRLQAA
jgi:hypothetical protein